MPRRVWLFREDFSQLLLNSVHTVVASNKDGAVRSKEDEFRDGVDAIEFGCHGLRVEDLGVRDSIVLDGT